MPDTTARIAGETRALIMDAQDNVAVAIRDLAAALRPLVTGSGSIATVDGQTD